MFDNLDHPNQTIRKIHPTTRFTASFCSGALILGAAGRLEGLPATTHWAGMSTLKALGARPQPEARIVDNGKILTAAGVSASIDLGLYLVARLLDEEQAKIAQLLIEYDPQPPFDAGRMSKAEKAVAGRAKRLMARLAATNGQNLIGVPKLTLPQWQRLARARR